MNCILPAYIISALLVFLMILLVSQSLGKVIESGKGPCFDQDQFEAQTRGEIRKGVYVIMLSPN